MSAPIVIQLPSTQASIEGLDWARAGGALAVVALHAAVPYAAHPMPGLAWPIRGASSTAVDIGFWSIELFIMPLFLIMAGFLAARTLARTSPAGLWKSRRSRLALPLVFGVVLVLPLELYVWVDGWVVSGAVPLRKLQSFKFENSIDANLWGTSHLWFLVYMLSYVAIAALAAMAMQRFASLKHMLSRVHGLVWMAVAIGLAASILAIHPEVVWGFQHQTLPVPSKWMYSGLSFIIGMLLVRPETSLLKLSRVHKPLASAAVVLIAAALAMGLWHLGRNEVVTPFGIPQPSNVAASPWSMALLGLVTATAGIGSALAIVAVAMRLARQNSVVRYISAASLWLYIMHHPVLGLIHIDLQFIAPAAGGMVAAAVSWALATAVTLAIYHLGVRNRRWAIAMHLVSPPAPVVRSEEKIRPANLDIRRAA